MERLTSLSAQGHISGPLCGLHTWLTSACVTPRVHFIDTKSHSHPLKTCFGYAEACMGERMRVCVVWMRFTPVPVIRGTVTGLAGQGTVWGPPRAADHLLHCNDSLLHVRIQFFTIVKIEDLCNSLRWFRLHVETLVKKNVTVQGVSWTDFFPQGP